MSLNFFDMLREEQEKEKKLAEELSKPTEAIEKPTSKKKAQTKVIDPIEKEVSQNAKKPSKTKRLSFEEQYEKCKGTPVQRVIDHLLGLGMKELMEHPDVTIEGMWKYITTEARKQAVNGSACIADEEVYGWGRHYYDEHGKVA